MNAALEKPTRVQIRASAPESKKSELPAKERTLEEVVHRLGYPIITDQEAR